MGLLMIAKLMDAQNNELGYRLFDTDAALIKDIPTQSLIAGMSRGVKIDNLGLINGELKGTNGSIDRYTVITPMISSYTSKPLVIIGKIPGGFRVVDFNGIVKNVREEDLIKYAEAIGIANGKVVTKDNSKFISSISGEYIELKSKGAINNNKRFVVVAFAHGARNIEKCISCNYFDIKTGKMLTKNKMMQMWESLGYEDTDCEIYATRDGYKEVHEEVFDIDPRNVVENRNTSIDWWYREVLIARKKDPKNISYIAAPRLYNGKVKEYNLYDILKMADSDNDSDKIVCDIIYEDDVIRVKTALDEHCYPKESTLRELSEYKKNVEVYNNKTAMLGMDKFTIDALGRLKNIKYEALDNIEIPKCVTEICESAISYSNRSRNISTLVVGSNVEKVHKNWILRNITIGLLETDSPAVCKAASAKLNGYTIKNMNVKCSIDKATLCGLMANVEDKLNINGSDKISAEFTVELLSNAFKKEELDKCLKHPYVLDIDLFRVNVIDLDKGAFLENYSGYVKDQEQTDAIPITNTFDKRRIKNKVEYLKRIIASASKMCDDKNVINHYNGVLQDFMNRMHKRDAEFMKNYEMRSTGKVRKYKLTHTRWNKDGEEAWPVVVTYEECYDTLGNRVLIKVDSTRVAGDVTPSVNEAYIKSIIEINSEKHAILEKYRI